MTLNKLTDIFNEYVAVDDYRREDDGLRFWMAARTSKTAKQAVIDDIKSLDKVEFTRKKWRMDGAVLRVSSAPEVDRPISPSTPNKELALATIANVQTRVVPRGRSLL